MDLSNTSQRNIKLSLLAAAVVFSLSACNGDDGADGVDGVNGADGQDGARQDKTEAQVLQLRLF